MLGPLRIIMEHVYMITHIVDFETTSMYTTNTNNTVKVTLHHYKIIS
jgi:hypothetical protein